MHMFKASSALENCTRATSPWDFISISIEIVISTFHFSTKRLKGVLESSSKYAGNDGHEPSPRRRDKARFLENPDNKLTRKNTELSRSKEITTYSCAHLNQGLDQWNKKTIVRFKIEKSSTDMY